jgi:hypothetical protein
MYLVGVSRTLVPSSHYLINIFLCLPCTHKLCNAPPLFEIPSVNVRSVRHNSPRPEAISFNQILHYQKHCSYPFPLQQLSSYSLFSKRRCFCPVIFRKILSPQSERTIYSCSLFSRILYASVKSPSIVPFVLFRPTSSIKIVFQEVG